MSGSAYFYQVDAEQILESTVAAPILRSVLSLVQLDVEHLTVHGAAIVAVGIAVGSQDPMDADG